MLRNFRLSENARTKQLLKIDYTSIEKVKLLYTFNGWRKLKTSADRAQNQHERLFLLHIENPFILPVNVVISTYIHNVRTFLQPESETARRGEITKVIEQKLSHSNLRKSLYVRH